MVRYTGPKNRIARRFGINVFGRLRNPLIHKPHPAGAHGAKRRKKSDFGLQLEEQQKLRAIYGMLPRRQLVNYYKKALKSPENTPQELVRQLESRLDVIVYRLKFGATIFHAQQLVSHGHVLVNGKAVNLRSFRVNPGMTVALKEEVHGNTVIKVSVANQAREVPAYLELDESKFQGKSVVAPEIDQVPFPMQVNIPLICEFLAHTS